MPDESQSHGLRVGGVVALVSALCLGASAPAPKMIKVDDSFNGREVALETGDVLEVSLSENASTGFQWSVKVKPDALLEFENAEAGPQAPAGPPGKAGVHHFSFKAVGAGSGELELEYRRSWEKQKAPARIYKLRVRVRG